MRLLLMFLVDPLTTPKPYWMKKWIQMTSALKSLAPTKVSRTLKPNIGRNGFIHQRVNDANHLTLSDSAVHRLSTSSPIQSLFIGLFLSSPSTLSAGNGHYLSSLASVAICQRRLWRKKIG